LSDEVIELRRKVLTVSDHDRNFSGMKYVYPVISRRAKGVSIGINLSPNNACNWRCGYCQVPNLVRGASPPLDFEIFETELDLLTSAICYGSYLEDFAPPEARVLKDFAFSGNGEPTSCPDFAVAVERVGEVRERFRLTDRTTVVLITNGSLAKQGTVRKGIAILAALGGEVWFKLDRGSDAALAATNGTPVALETHVRRLLQTSHQCRTRVQSCWFTTHGVEPSSAEQDDFVGCLETALSQGAKIASVQLYTLARKPLLPEGSGLGPVSASWLSELAFRVARLGVSVDDGSECTEGRSP
jgi:hypothetical protein